MSLRRRVRAIAQQASGADRLDVMERRLSELFELCAVQNHLVHEMHALLVRGAVDSLDESLTSFAVAHAESMVYLNRAVRQLQATLNDREALISPTSQFAGE